MKIKNGWLCWAKSQNMVYRYSPQTALLADGILIYNLPAVQTVDSPRVGPSRPDKDMGGLTEQNGVDVVGWCGVAGVSTFRLAV